MGWFPCGGCDPPCLSCRSCAILLDVSLTGNSVCTSCSDVDGVYTVTYVGKATRSSVDWCHFQAVETFATACSTTLTLTFNLYINATKVELEVVEEEGGTTYETHSFAYTIASETTCEDLDSVTLVHDGSPISGTARCDLTSSTIVMYVACDDGSCRCPGYAIVKVSAVTDLGTCLTESIEGTYLVAMDETLTGQDSCSKGTLLISGFFTKDFSATPSCSATPGDLRIIVTRTVDATSIASQVWKTVAVGISNPNGFGFHNGNGIYFQASNLAPAGGNVPFSSYDSFGQWTNGTVSIEFPGCTVDDF